MSLPTPDDFDPTPYDIEAEDDEPGGDCMFPEPGDEAA
jgi:hypothetical protein